MTSEGSYPAKAAYQDYSVAERYEELRFSGWLGRYRWRREQAAVGAMVERLPGGVKVLDCPCGTGRWWKVLSSRATAIVGADVSPGMLRYAAERAERSGISVELLEAEAEKLPFGDESVDYTFSHALTKHLPIPVQANVLREFARVSRFGVVCSFSIFSHASYEFWRRRRPSQSYPLLSEQLEWLADAAGLDREASKKCTTPIGVEHSVLFKKRRVNLTGDSSGTIPTVPHQDSRRSPGRKC
jgi:ubiquinone/menaquinone biosynthesis C-methylase UbiE